MTSVYRDADGLRAAMKRCSNQLAARVLANEYLRACGKHSAKLDYPLWLKDFMRSSKTERKRHGKHSARVIAPRTS